MDRAERRPQTLTPKREGCETRSQGPFALIPGTGALNGDGRRSAARGERPIFVPTGKALSNLSTPMTSTSLTVWVPDVAPWSRPHRSTPDDLRVSVVAVGWTPAGARLEHSGVDDARKTRHAAAAVAEAADAWLRDPRDSNVYRMLVDAVERWRGIARPQLPLELMTADGPSDEDGVAAATEVALPGTLGDGIRDLTRLLRP